MEAEYGVGVNNRYSLFLEEGENELPIIKKKLTKEIKAKNKQEKKSGAKKVVVDEKIPASGNFVSSSETQSEQNIELKKEDEPKNTEKEKEDKRDIVQQENKPAQKPKNIDVPVTEQIENWDDVPNATNEVPPARKNYDNRKSREFRNENYDRQPRNYPNTRRNNRDDSIKVDTFNNDISVEEINTDDGWANQQDRNDYNTNSERHRGGRSRGGGRGNYGGGDRWSKNYDSRQENGNNDAEVITGNDQSDVGWGEENPDIAGSPDNEKEIDVNESSDSVAPNANYTVIEQKEEEKETLTLDEWKKLRGNREKPQFNVRKAGEGEDLSQWKNMRALQKQNESEEFLKNGLNNQHNSHKKNEDKENTSAENSQKKGPQKIVDLDFHFRQPIRGGGGRGRGMRNKFRQDDRNNGEYRHETRTFNRNRGGGLPGRGRNSTRQNTPKISDEHDFPSLG